MFALKGASANWILLALSILHGGVQAGFVIDQASCTGQDIAGMLTEVSEQAGLANQATSGSLNSQLSPQVEILVSNTFDSFFGSQMTQDSNGNSQQAGQLARAQTVISEWLAIEKWLPQELIQAIDIVSQLYCKEYQQ